MFWVWTTYRINKKGSQKDSEQKAAGNYFFYGDDDEDEEDDDWCQLEMVFHFFKKRKSISFAKMRVVDWITILVIDFIHHMDKNSVEFILGYCSYDVSCLVRNIISRLK